MKEVQQNARIGCFGKLPDRGDFFRFRQTQPSALSFDTWIQQGLHMARSSLGKAFDQTYSSAGVYRFHLSPMRSGQTLLGTLGFSRDRHGRAFPLVCFATSPLLEGPDVGWRIAASSTLFHALDRLTAEAIAGLPVAELTPALEGLEALTGPQPADRKAFKDFLDQGQFSGRWSVSMLAEASAAVAASRRQVPRLWQWGLTVPLGYEESELEFEAAFWSMLLTNLSRATRLRPALFWTAGAGQGRRPLLWFFFRDPSARVLTQLITGEASGGDVVDLGRRPAGAWRAVDGAMAPLMNPDLTLRQVIELSAGTGGGRSRSGG